MTLSMYDASVPAFVNMLGALSGLLAKGEDYAKSKGIEPQVLLNDRLAPDMFAFTRQIQIATDMVRLGAARLARAELPSAPDTETSFEELKARVSSTIAYLKSLDRAAFEGAESRSVTIKAGPTDRTFPGDVYLFEFVIPNFYFHSAMAYAILRHNGAPLAKSDFLAGLAPYFTAAA